ncbi:MAG: hypothetical protein WCA32_13955 [Chromatiaceae bacterium]
MHEADRPKPCPCGDPWGGLAKISLDYPLEDIEELLTLLLDPRLLGGLLRLLRSFALVRPDAIEVMMAASGAGNCFTGCFP